MKSISIIGATISGNRGAEAMLSTVIGHIREDYPDTVFNVFSYYPADDRSVCIDNKISIYSATPVSLVLAIVPFACLLELLKVIRLDFLKRIFPKAVRVLNDSDVLIDISGVSFMDDRVTFIPFNVLTIFPAMTLRTPVVKFSQALGPFKNPLVYISAKMFLSRCTRIFARGESTKQNVQALNLPENILNSAADVAFLHKNTYSLSKENCHELSSLVQRLRELKEKGKTVIGLCPSSVIASKSQKEKWNYVELLYNIIRILSEKGFAVLLFPNATREKSRKLRNNDLPVIEKTARYLAAFDEYPTNLLVVTRDINTEGIKTLLAYCEVNVVSRFHAMIYSLVLEKPVVVMGWGHKYQEVMDQFELGNLVFDYKNKSTELLADKVLATLERKEEIKGNITKNLPKVLKNSERQFSFLSNLLSKNQYEK
jgi:colanic acid/amylovoran biosynthesis protein